MTDSIEENKQSDSIDNADNTDSLAHSENEQQGNPWTYKQENADVTPFGPTLTPPPQMPPQAPLPPIGQPMANATVPVKPKKRYGTTVWLIILSVLLLLQFCVIFSLADTISHTSSDGDASAMLNNVFDSCVSISVNTGTGKGTGSGIVLTSDGYICTNYHVVENAKSITVYFYSGDEKQAELIGYSKTDDLALLKVSGIGYRAATIGSSQDCRVGDRVYAIGTPAGLDYAWTVTSGIVSYPDRVMKIYASDGSLEKKMHVIQTDTQVNPGNSGGALVNAYGEVVGVVSMKLSGSSSLSSGSYEGLGFAIQIEGAMEILNEIKRTGSAEGITSPVTSARPVLGISAVSVTAGEYYMLTETGIKKIDEEVYLLAPDRYIAPKANGIYITQINQDSDANGKLEIGDIITEVEGIAVANVQEDVWPIINEMNGGDTVTLTVYRSKTDTIETVQIVLGTQS